MRHSFVTTLAAVLALSALALSALVLPVQGLASAQTPAGPTISLPKPPVAPTAPKAATSSSSDSADQLAVMRAARDAQADLRSLFPPAGAARPPQSGATSNPCERAGLGASLSCIDGIKRQLARARLPAVEKSQLDADLAILRDTLKDAQFGSARQRANLLAEARQRADRIDAMLTKLTEPRPPATAGLPLDKLIPGLVN